jgi:hypothetical protein
VFVALKRTLGLLGAWPWDTDSYDRTFSNEFSHGSSRGPGLAGVQRWAKIEPTGWVGQSTWNFLRSVLIQEWKDLGGFHAMDEIACELIRNADRAKQKLPPFTGWTTDRSRVQVGDLAVIGGRGVHVETVRGFDGTATLTWGGNTSSGSIGSQANGGGAFPRWRSPASVYGYALVRYPGES